MPNPKRSRKRRESDIHEVLHTLLIRLRDLDRKVEHIVRRLPRCNGRHDPLHPSLNGCA